MSTRRLLALLEYRLLSATMDEYGEIYGKICEALGVDMYGEPVRPEASPEAQGGDPCAS